MLWPSFADYELFVKNAFAHSVLDPRLKNGTPMKGISGGFSRVYPVKVASNTFALRCWVKDVGDLKNRYRKISVYLKQVHLPYFVDFEYVSEGILINGTKYPTTRMEWTEGVSLRVFIEQNLQNSHIFKIVADEFQEMVATLHKHRISHGDFQDGNILLTKNNNAVGIKLIDYDSLFVPALQGQPEQIVGLPEYQHPIRIMGGGQVNEKVDYFSELVIYLSFLSLAEKPELWNRFKDKTEKGLLFSKKDFENSNQSDIFQELKKLSPDIQQLAATLKGFCAKTSIDQLAPLEAILPKPDANAYCDQAESFLNDERYDEALEKFQKAIDIKPDYARAHFGRGHVYRRTKRQVNAIIAFQQAIKFKPNYKEAHYGLGLAYFESGDSNKAITAVNVSLKIDPNYQPARQLLDFIKSTAPPSVRPTQPGPVSPPPRQKPPTSNPKPAASDSASNPGPTTPDSVSPTPKSETNVWQYLTFFFGIALVVCAVVLAAQIDEKNTALRKIKAKDIEIQQLSSNFQTLKDGSQTLEDEKRTLNNENKKLKRQLAEKDAEIQRLTSRVSSFQLPTRNSMELAGMVLIPAGDFRMGSNATAAYSDEKPVHTVYINAFYIDKYEVTNEEYKRFIDANPWWRKDRILGKYHDGDYLKHWIGNRYPDGKGNHPVTWVSWYAAMAYAQWEGKRLPTEAEWEKAARGGLVNNYLSGNLVNSQTANYDKNVGSATRIGNYQANPYGLYDMVGNVSEWCLDTYNSNFYANSARRNPVAGGSIYSIVRDFKSLNVSRVLRGGSWSSSASYVRIAYRSNNSPVRTSNTTGFRCVKPVNP